MENATCNDVIRAIRRIIRAIDMNSKKVVQKYGLTGPQLIILKELFDQGSCPVGNLAKGASLSHATVTEIIDRLEKKGCVTRSKSPMDKRKIFVSLTDQGKELIEKKPSLIQEKFASAFDQLPNWEQNLILSNFQKVAHLMDAENIDAAAILVNSSNLNGEDSLSH